MHTIRLNVTKPESALVTSQFTEWLYGVESLFVYLSDNFCTFGILDVYSNALEV